MSRRLRRHTSREHLADAHDNEHLIICDTCQIIYLKVGPNTLLQQNCPHCAGTIVDWADRASIARLAQRLDCIRQGLGQISQELH